MKVDLSYDELFLLEMAVDQVLYMLNDFNSPVYKRFDLIDKKLGSLRCKAKAEVSAESTT